MGCKLELDKKPVLSDCVDFYKMDEAVYPRFKSEVNRWIDNSWLVKTKYNEEGVIPLMAVVQEKKDKVRPILKFVECTGQTQMLVTRN